MPESTCYSLEDIVLHVCKMDFWAQFVITYQHDINCIILTSLSVLTQLNHVYSTNSVSFESHHCIKQCITLGGYRNFEVLILEVFAQKC